MNTQINRMETNAYIMQKSHKHYMIQYYYNKITILWLTLHYA
jgi:hypothetical protein